jgi:hypothetical protein
MPNPGPEVPLTQGGNAREGLTVEATVLPPQGGSDPSRGRLTNGANARFGRTLDDLEAEGQVRVATERANRGTTGTPGGTGEGSWLEAWLERE